MIEIKAPNGQIIEIEGSTIPTEAELDEIFKATGTNGKPLTKSVMDASDGQIYNAPIGMDATDINFNIQTQHKGLNKADFFGKVATSLNPINAIDNVKDTYNQISKALETGDFTKEDMKDAFVKSSVQLAQNVTNPVLKVAEFVTESNTSKAVAKSVVDVAGSFSNAVVDTVTGFQDLEVAKETGVAPESLIAGARVRFDAIVNGTDYKTSVNKLLESTKKLKDKNKKFFEETSKNILPNEEMDKLDQLVYGVSNGLTSIGAAVGMALMTKNPTAGSAIVAASFGKMQQSEYYDKSREAGYSAERSQFYGNIAGIANAGLEFVGNKILLGLGGVKPIKAINENVIKTTIAKLGKNEATKGAAAKIISKHLNSVGKQGLKAFGSEFGEEFLQEGFEAALEKATGVTDASWSEVLNNAIYSGFIGGISGGIFGSTSTAITNNQIKAHNEKIKGFIKATQSDLTEEELQVTADIVQEMLFQEASNYQDQVSKHIEKELDIDVAPEGLTKESLLKQTRDSLKSKFGMTDEEIDKYCDSALTAIDARNQYNEVFTSFRDALIGIGIDSNKAGATAQLLSARALSAAIDSKTTAQDIVKRFKLKFERENFNKNNYKSVLDDDFIPFQKTYYQFGGVGAVTAALDKLEMAKRAEENGYSNEEIWNEYGWIRGEDGKWRFEISDEDAFVNTHIFNNKKYVLEDVLVHDKLYEAYPIIANVETFVDEDLKDTPTMAAIVYSHYDKYNNPTALPFKLKINPDALSKKGDELKSILLHEVQHIIQRLEGFATGGNPNFFRENKEAFQQAFKDMANKKYKKALYDELYSKVDVALGDEILDADEKSLKASKEWMKFVFDNNGDENSPEALKLEDNYDNAKEYLRKTLEQANLTTDDFAEIKKKAREKAGMDAFYRVNDVKHYDEYDLYKRLYGEIEARNTQARMNMSESERLATLPETTQDFSNDEAIVVFGDGTIANLYSYKPENVNIENGVVDLTDAFDGIPTIKEVEEFVADIVAKGGEFYTKTPNRKIKLPKGAYRQGHLSHTNGWNNLSLEEKERHNMYVEAYKELIENSIYSGNKENTERDNKHKRKVKAYHYFKVKVKIGDTIYNVVLDTEEFDGVKNTKPQITSLYNVKEVSPSKKQSTKAMFENNGETSYEYTITPNSEKVNSKVQNQGEQSAPRGAYDVTNHIIKLFETADTSTLIHELGHFFLEDLKDYANDVNSINMLEEVYRYLGVKDGVITSEQHELFADSFEKYVLNGKAPNSTLAKCFQAFARWLRNLKYEIQRLGNVKLSDDITKTFDKMLGGKALDFAMQNSSLQLQEQLDSGNLPRHIIDRAIKMLEDGIISRADMDDIVAKLRTGELKKKEVASELKRLEGLNVKHHEALNPFDTMKYRQQLSAGNFDKAKVIAKIERLVDWTKPRTSGGKEVGRFPNKQLNDLFDNVRNILAMSKEDARAKIRENLDKLGDAFTTQSALDDGETREALIFENKLLSIPAKRTSAQNLIDVYNALSESYNLGRLSDSLTKRAKKERREGMIKTALQTISGDVNPSIEQSKISQFLNKLGSSQYAWQGLLDILSMNDKTSKTGKSALNKMLDVFEAEQQEARGVADDGEIFSEIAARKFASNNNHKIALSRYVDKELSKESILTWGKYRKKFTKDQLIDIYMKSLDPETREIMINDEINGFNEEFLSLVKQELTSDDLAFADALFEFYKQNYDKINPYYEERFGVSLGKRDYYSPRSMERTGTNLDTGDIISFAGFGNIKKRTVKNKGTIKVKGAFKTFNEYVVNSNHYLAWSEKLIDINAVFGNVEIKNAISNIFGKSMLNRIDYEISRFASNDTFQKKFSLGVNFNKLRSNYAKSVLGLKPSLAIKQLTSFPAYLENMSSVEFMAGVTDFFKHPKEAMELLGNTTLMKTRDVNIIKDFAELSKLDILKGKSGVKFSDLMMLNIKLGDRGAIYVGGWALYKAELKKNLAKGMTQSEAKKKALETFERVTDETQQSGRMSQQSYWQSNPFLRAFTMFQSSQNQYFRKELNAVRGLVTGRMDGKQAAKTIFIYHFLLPMLFQYASDGFEWDKDAQLRTALIGSLNGVFVLNALLGKLYDAASTGSFTSGTMRVRDVIPFYGAIEDMSKFLVQLLNGEIEPDWSDYMDVLETFSKPLQTAGELTGLPVKYPLDVIKNFGSYAEDEEYGKETLLWLGWSPYALRDKE